MAEGPLRIAICFVGKADGIATHHAPRDLTTKRGGHSTGPAAPRKLDCLTGWESIRKHVYAAEKGHVYDTFFHAWIENKKRKSELCKVLKPLAHVAEKQIEFHTHPYYQRVQSRMHSLVTSFELAMKHSESTGKKYDFFVFLRYDLFFRNFVDYTTLHDNVFYHSGWQKHRHNVHDYFWIGSQSVIQDIIIPLTKECHEWCKSPYERKKGGEKIPRKSKKVMSIHRFYDVHLDNLPDAPQCHSPILNHTKDFHICRDLWWDSDSPNQDGDLEAQAAPNIYGIEKPISPFDIATTWATLVSEFNYYE